MKVLFITKTLHKGGAASGAKNLINALRCAGAEVIPLDAYEAQSRKGIGFLRKSERILERIFFDAGTHCLRMGPPTFNLLNLYAEHQPDIIQLGDVSGNTIRFSDLKKLRCPVVHRMSDFWPYHGARHYADTIPNKLSFADHLLSWTIYNGKHKPDTFVAPSDWLANQLGETPVQVIRNAVSATCKIEPRVTQSQPLRFGFISNPLHDPRKGIDTLPKFLNSLAKHTGEIELHLFGHGRFREVSFIPEVKCHFHGTFSPKDIAATYSKMDILLCPSKKDNSPNVITEALAHGVPVIAQTGTGMDSYVQYTFGALVDFQNGYVEHFLDEVNRLAVTYNEASSSALQYANSDLAPTKIGRAYLDIYAELITNGSRS